MKQQKDNAGKELMVFMISTFMRYREGEISKKEAYEEVKEVNTTLRHHRDMKKLSEGIFFLNRN